MKKVIYLFFSYEKKNTLILLPIAVLKNNNNENPHLHSRVLQDCTLLSIPSKNLYFQAILSMLLIHTRATGRWSNSGNGNKWNSPVVPSYSPQQQTFSAPSNCQSTIYSVDPRKPNCKLRYKCKRECKKVNKKECTTKPKLTCSTYKKKKCSWVTQTICPGNNNRNNNNVNRRQRVKRNDDVTSGNVVYDFDTKNATTKVGTRQGRTFGQSHP